MSRTSFGMEPGNKTLELTAYDQQRQPQKAIVDCTEIVVSPRSLASELCCPICLDLLTNTMTTKECLHRFCSDCITTALLRGNKECPTCRKKLVSKRSLRPDPNFDALISKIWPDREEYDAMQERAMQRFNSQNSTEVLTKCIEAGMKAQAQHRRQRVQGSYDYEKRKKRSKVQIDEQNSTSISTMDDDHFDEESEEIDLILRAHPEFTARNNVADYSKQSRYLKTTAMATVDHLCKYLAMRIHLDGRETKIPEKIAENGSALESTVASMTMTETMATSTTIPNNCADPPDIQCIISVLKENEDESNRVILDGNLTLFDVRIKYWTPTRPLQLDFQLENPPLK